MARNSVRRTDGAARLAKAISRQRRRQIVYSVQVEGGHQSESEQVYESTEYWILHCDHLPRGRALSVDRSQG